MTYNSRGDECSCTPASHCPSVHDRMVYPPPLLTAVGFAAALAGTLTPARSATILQGVADTFVAFEAETHVVVTNGPVGTSNQFINFADASASGGMALIESNPGDPFFN